MILALCARALNALGMFIAIRRFIPAAFGELGYFQATAVSAVAFTSFGLDLSINAQLTRKQAVGGDIRSTVAAGCILALVGIALAIVVVSVGFSSQLEVSSSPALATLGLCIYCASMIATSLVNAVSFALKASVNVGIAYVSNSLLFIAFAVLAAKSISGTALLFCLTIAQFCSLIFLIVGAIASYRRFRKPKLDAGTDFLAETRAELKTLLSYGTKQILVVSVVAFSQWLIQRKIVFGGGGTDENAIYTVGNQVFNIMTFIPVLLSPMVVTRLAAAGNDRPRRRAICVSSMRLFGGIAACAIVGTFIALHVGVRFLPPRYGAAVETGVLASIAAAIQILKAPFSLYFLSELRASREFASAVAGSAVMIAISLYLEQLHPNSGTLVRLAGGIVQTVFLASFFVIEARGPLSNEP